MLNRYGGEDLIRGFSRACGFLGIRRIAYPDLVVSDNNGEILTVRYDQVNAMLFGQR
jgi:hypothetical protein